MRQLRVLNILAGGGVGGVETLCLNAAEHSKNENSYLFLREAGIISDEMKLKGYKVHVLNTSQSKYLPDSLKVVNLCMKNKYDVVVCHNNSIMSALCIFWISVFCNNTKVIAYIHCSLCDLRKRDLYSAKFVCRSAKKVVCISDSVLNSAREYIGSSDKLVKIYNGIDLKKFQQDKNEKTGNRIIYVGRLAQGKGVQIILQALSIVSVDFSFAIIGDGEYREQLENLTADLGLENRVTFYGSRTDVQKFLSNADIFIHVPILEEGFGLTVVEAMAAGLTCICSKSGAIPEVLQDGESGYLVEQDNPEQLAETILSVIENYDSAKNKQLRENAIMKAKEFSIEAYTDSLDHLVDITTYGGG